MQIQIQIQIPVQWRSIMAAIPPKSSIFFAASSEFSKQGPTLMQSLSRGESAYQKLCSEITVEFNECSKQVLELESLFLSPDCFRDDLAHLLRAIQAQEKQKLQLTATIQVLKKAGRPSERLVSHENCRFKKHMEHECVHVHEITEAVGTEEAEADAEYDNALKEAIRGVQDAVTSINEHLEEVRYEIAALEADE
ncbi:Myosin-11 like [Actinidia chinensis var. chinensis]|uniref:Myosin-11 like n=1 Tax=Actinidia chinensis var. chinensis TaxID=1590841 RepID=A0A2R6QY83_ACTCC|nr:Myosin-11 like [Actinidia chinensis var. chinensis]